MLPTGASNPPASTISAEAHQRAVEALLAKKGYTATGDTSISLKSLQQALPKASDDVDLESYLAYLTAVDETRPVSEKSDDSWMKAYEFMESWVDSTMEPIRIQLNRLLWPLFVQTKLQLLRLGLSSKADLFFRKHVTRFRSDPRYTDHIVQLSLVTVKEHVEGDEEDGGGGGIREYVDMWKRARWRMVLSKDAMMTLGQLLKASLDEEDQNEPKAEAERVLVSEDEQQCLLVIRQILEQYVSFKTVNTFEQAENLSNIGFEAIDAPVIRQSQTKLVLTSVPRAKEVVAGFTGDEGESIYREELRSAFDAAMHASDSDPVLRERMEEEYQAYIKTRDAAAAASLDPSVAKEIPLPSTRRRDIAAAVREIQDAAHRVRLGPGSLPSICFYTFHNTKEDLLSVHFAPEHIDMAATGHADSAVRVWSLDGKTLRGLRSGERAPIDGSASLEALKEKTGPMHRKLIGHSGPVSFDGSARLWSLDTWSCIVAYRGHTRPVWDLAIGPRGYYFATASADRTARVWSTEVPSPVRILAGHLSDVECIDFHPNGRYIATGSGDRSARLWDVNSGRTVRVFPGHESPVISIATSPDGTSMVTGSMDGAVRLWDLADGKLILDFGKSPKGTTSAQGSDATMGHSGPVWSVSWSADSKVIGSGSADGTVRIWDAVTATSWASSHIGGTSHTMRAKTDTSMEEGRQPSSNDTKRFELGAYPTKNTPVIQVQFSSRNLLLASGPYKTDQPKLLT